MLRNVDHLKVTVSRNTTAPQISIMSQNDRCGRGGHFTSSFHCDTQGKLVDRNQGDVDRR